VVPSPVPVPSSGASRTVIVASCTPPPAETEARNTIKSRYKFGGLFAEAEFISGIPIKRVAQAKRYHRISYNFVGSWSNFEYDPQDGRSRAEVARARESDETRQQWRMRMFGGGGMPVDAIMMMCHPTLYQSMIEDNPNYFEAAIAEQDQRWAFGAWLRMSRALQVTHRVDDSMLPDPAMWEQVRANNPAGVGITMPSGRLLPETVAKSVNDYTGLVVVSEAMVDKLGQVESHVTELTSMMHSERREARPAVMDRLGPQTSKIAPSETSQNPQNAKIKRSVGTVAKASNFLVLSKAGQEEVGVTDIEDAGRSVREVILDDNAKLSVRALERAGNCHKIFPINFGKKKLKKIQKIF
jgi:hypothetical protein